MGARCTRSAATRPTSTTRSDCLPPHLDKPMTPHMTIELARLATISGGVQRGQSREQINERYKNLCLAPDPKTARQQYDTMIKQMVPDSSEAAGIKHRAIQAI